MNKDTLFLAAERFKNMRLFIFSILIFFSNHLIAQVQVSGRVTDKKGNPIESVFVQAQQGEALKKSFTDTKGRFELELQSGFVEFTFEYQDTARIARQYSIPNEATFQLEEIQFNFTKLDEFTLVRTKKEGIIELEKIDFSKQVLTGVERYLVLTTAATSRNELTSNYNVRGGNYDENLVYVNGFLVNRPFLTRSGQQEGLSFINTALVDNVYFSAGGFQANYGDKLSSVLDIVYKRPDSLHASLTASLLATEAHVEQGIGSRFRYLFGARYRSNGYLLNSLPTKGNYNPIFWDTQLLTEYDITDRWKWTILGHISSNDYRFAPETQKTDFGTANEAYSFNIYFDGQEATRFLTATAGTSLQYTGRKYQSTTYFTAFQTDEKEYFDIQGQYYINELETDPSKEEFGDSIQVLGVGTFLNHARNRLKASIFGAYHDASYSFSKNQKLKWGLGVHKDDFNDVLSEWRMIDSAGYSVPQNTPNEVDLFEVIKGKLSLQNVRSYAYLQFNREFLGKAKLRVLNRNIEVDSSGFKKVVGVQVDTLRGGRSKWEYDIGTRVVYTSFNGEGMVTPRASISYIPVRYVYHNGQYIRRSVKWRLASGLYYQPPFYREYRTFTGGINPMVMAQKSLHVVLGTDYSFYMWKREQPFKITAETYYKYLWDINTYEVENVRTRYYADNNAKGYATGFDFNMHGEFVKGIQSFLKIGLLSTKEDVGGDNYWNYYNKAGEKIIFGYSEDQVAVDSVHVFPGSIRRPTDQNLNIGILFQDNMPGFEQFGAQLGLTYGSRTPYGPPDYSRYKDTLTIRSYFRVDMGLTYDFLHKRNKRDPNGFHRFKEAILSFEVFNLLGVNNVLSKQWIQDVSGSYYSIPNYLTQRRFNLKMIIRI